MPEADPKHTGNQIRKSCVEKNAQGSRVDRRSLPYTSLDSDGSLSSLH